MVAAEEEEDGKPIVRDETDSQPRCCGGGDPQPSEGSRTPPARRPAAEMRQHWSHLPRGPGPVSPSALWRTRLTVTPAEKLTSRPGLALGPRMWRLSAAAVVICPPPRPWLPLLLGPPGPPPVSFELLLPRLPPPRTEDERFRGSLALESRVPSPAPPPPAAAVERTDDEDADADAQDPSSSFPAPPAPVPGALSLLRLDDGTETPTFPALAPPSTPPEEGEACADFLRLRNGGRPDNPLFVFVFFFFVFVFLLLLRSPKAERRLPDRRGGACCSWNPDSISDPNTSYHCISIMCHKGPG